MYFVIEICALVEIMKSIDSLCYLILYIEFLLNIWQIKKSKKHISDKRIKAPNKAGFSKNESNTYINI